MRRKIFICFFVVLLMTTLVAPAFASSVDRGDGSGSDSPAIPIDYIEFLDGSYSGAIADWPNNFGKDAIDVSCVYDFVAFRCYRSNTGSSAGQFSTSVYSGDASSVRLFCSDIFLAPSLVFELNDDSEGNVVFETVTITGSYVLPYESGDAYALSHTSFSKSFSVNSSEVDLFALLKEAGNTGDILPNDDLWLQDVSITISFSFLDSLVARYFNVVASNSRFDNDFEDWFIAYRFASTGDVVVDSELPGMFDWLLDSINAFLDFEIAPDLSLNKLFFIVLVIIVLVAFIKILS